jgi:hypothetical protein
MALEIYQNGGLFDIQQFMTSPLMRKIPWIRKYEGEFHYPPNYAYLGPGTRLDIRLDENDKPKEGEQQISPTDQLAYEHDLAYRDAGNNLDLKHEADRKMLEALEKVPTTGINDKLANFVAKQILKLKLKMGMGISQEKAIKISKELHSRIIHKFPRRKVMVNHIDEIHAGDLMDFSKDPLYYRKKKYTFVLVNIDIFSKFCWCIVVPNKDVEHLIWAYEQIFKERTPKKLWFDREKAVDSKKFNEFLEKYEVELYHTYSEIKVSVAERMIRTLKEKCERIKTEYRLLKKNYNLIDILPKVLEEYNYNSVHTTTGFTPIDASKRENEPEIQKKYYEKYLNYNPPNGRLFKLGDRVRIYSYKYLFDKGYKKNWTEEIFEIVEIHQTKPITYSLEDSNGERIDGKFYSWELHPTKL